MSAGTSGFGTYLIWNYQKVAELTNIEGPSQSMDTIDVSNHSSADMFKEYIAGLRAGGEVSLEGNFIYSDTNGQIALKNDVQSGTPRNFKIVPPMALGISWEGIGLANGFNTTFPYGEKTGVTGTITVTGKPSLYTTQSAGIQGLTGIESKDNTALTITPAVAAGTYAYVCTVNTASTWVKLTVTSTASIYVNGVSQTSAQQGGQINLGAAGTVTDILIITQEASKAPRLYILSVTRP